MPHLSLFARILRCVALMATALGASPAPAAIFERDLTYQPALESGAQVGSVSFLAYPGGKVLVSNSNGIVNGRRRAESHVLLNHAGQVDESFAPGTRAFTPLAVYADGRVLFWEVATSEGAGAMVGRLLPSGADDPTFTSLRVNSYPFSATLGGDGKILLRGLFSSVGGAARKALARLNADGTLDESFQPPFPESATPAVNHAMPSADGSKIWISGGAFGLGTGRTHLARLNVDGSVDASFSTGAATFSPFLAGVVEQPDGAVLVRMGSTLRRFLADGTPDVGFIPALVGTLSNFGASDVAGKPFYVTSRSDGSGAYFELRWMNEDGSDDATFTAIRGAGLPQLGDDGAFFLGALTAERSAGNLAVTRVVPGEGIDPLFNPRFGSGATIDAAVMQPDGQHLVAGAFRYVNGEAMGAALSIVRLRINGERDPDFFAGFPTENYVTKLMLQPDGKILVEGERPQAGQPTIRLWRLTASGEIDPTFAESAEDAAVSAVDEQGRIYRATSTALARYTVNGQLDATFQSTEPPSAVGAMSPLADGSVLVSRVANISSASVRRLRADGTEDTAFLTSNVQAVVALIALPDGRAGGRIAHFRTGRSEGVPNRSNQLCGHAGFPLHDAEDLEHGGLRSAPGGGGRGV